MLSVPIPWLPGFGLSQFRTGSWAEEIMGFFTEGNGRYYLLVGSVLLVGIIVVCTELPGEEM